MAGWPGRARGLAGLVAGELAALGIVRLADPLDIWLATLEAVGLVGPVASALASPSAGELASSGGHWAGQPTCHHEIQPKCRLS